MAVQTLPGFASLAELLHSQNTDIWWRIWNKKLEHFPITRLPLSTTEGVDELRVSLFYPCSNGLANPPTLPALPVRRTCRRWTRGISQLEPFQECVHTLLSKLSSIHKTPMSSSMSEGMASVFSPSSLSCISVLVALLLRVNAPNPLL